MSIAALQQLPSIKNSFGSVFPLPLTLLESFMVADSRPAYPMLADVELQFQGRLDRAALASALSFAVVVRLLI